MSTPGGPDTIGESPPAVSLEGPLARARFVERPNRFLVRCRLAGEQGVVEAHLPDPGRLEELLRPDRRVRLRPADRPSRKTDWTLVLVETPDGSGWVSLDTTLPNRLVERALRRGWLDELAGWELHGREVPLGDSRIDFVLAGEVGRRMALEVKSVTLVDDGVGLFPDAVTARGARHVRELQEAAAEEGWEAGVLFVVQRRDVHRVVAAPEIDPEFSRALREAREHGVAALARRCRVDTEAVVLGAAVPVAEVRGG